jgi:putative flippase GtrA
MAKTLVGLRPISGGGGTRTDTPRNIPSYAGCQGTAITELTHRHLEGSSAILRHMRLRWRPSHATITRLMHFACIGALSTVLYVVMFAGLTRITPVIIANAAALIVSTALNTEMNRRFTFGMRGATKRVAAHVTGAVTLAVALAMTTTALGVVRSLVNHPDVVVELSATFIATAGATAFRYLLMQRYAVAGSPILRDNRTANAQPAHADH